MRARGLAVAEVDHVEREPQLPASATHLIAEHGRELDHLAVDRDPLARVGEVEQRRASGREHREPRRRIADLANGRDRIARERHRAAWIDRGLQRRSEPSEHARAHGRDRRSEPRERLFEQADEHRIDDREREVLADPERGASEALGVVTAPREIGGPQTHLAPLHRLTTADVREAEREQCIDPQTIGRTRRVERTGAALEDRDRFLVRVQLDGALRRLTCVTHGALGTRDRDAGDEVTREPDRAGAGIDARRRFDRLGDPRVYRGPAGLVDAAVDRVAQQHVRECEAIVVACDEHVGRDRHAQGRANVVDRHRGGASDERDVELAPERCADLEQCARRLGQRRETVAEHCERTFHWRGRPRARSPQSQRLDHEQRVALGRAHELVDERVVRVEAELCRERADLVAVQARERDRRRMASHAGEGIAGRRHEARLGVAVRAEDRDRLRAHALGDEQQQLERRQIGGVQIVEHDRDRPLARAVSQHASDRIEAPKPTRGGIARVGRCGRHPELRHELRDLGERRGLDPRSSVREDLAQHFDPRPQRRGTTGLPRSAPGDAHTRALGRVRERARERRFADARLAVDEQHGAAPRRRIFDRLLHERELVIAPDQRGHRRHPSAYLHTRSRAPRPSFAVTCDRPRSRVHRPTPACRR